MNMLFRNSIGMPKLAYNTICKQFKRLISHKQFKVSPFCQINIVGPFDINACPLDVFEHQDCDKVIVEGRNKVVQDGDDITITSEDDTLFNACNITAPIKASFSINNANNVNIRNFHCDQIDINATQNIIIEKCYAENIKLTTINGNITSKNIIQAANILLQCENGNIKTGKLQGINLQVQTKNGNISIDSTYCDTSHFQTSVGNINLNNAHKNVNVSIKEAGNLDIIGLDGSLDAFINKGDTNLYLARLLANSKLAHTNAGNVMLKLVEDSQEQINIEIESKHCKLCNDVSMNLTKLDDKFYLNPKLNVENSKKILLECKDCSVTIGTMNWSEMFSLQFNKRNES